MAVDVPPGTEGAGQLRMESSIIFAPGDNGGSAVLETVIELSRSSRDYKVSACKGEKKKTKITEYIP